MFELRILEFSPGVEILQYRTAKKVQQWDVEGKETYTDVLTEWLDVPKILVNAESYSRLNKTND